MSFDKELKKAVNEIDIPEMLLPENIEAMLKAAFPERSEKTDMPAEIVRTKAISAKSTNRAIIMRTLAAAAACVALAAGFTAFREETARSSEPIESEIDYRAVQVQSYDELYNIYTGIYLNNSDKPSGAENGDGVEIITDETAITGETTTAVSEAAPPITEAAPPTEAPLVSKETIEAVRSDFSDADIVKSDDNSIYYICEGTLYAVSKEDMSVTARIECASIPFEMYVRGSSLVLISEENASDDPDNTEKNVVADIYDTASGTPTPIGTYKQNGSYISARMDENGVLYLVTGYSDYRTHPLDENAELESYVPGYYIDGEKHYVAAEDISIPQNANNTDYTVISYVNCTEPADASVKAVLGSSSNVYCSDDTLYIAGSTTKDGETHTFVTSFSIAGGLEYKASAALKGELISRFSMAEYEELFRIACRSFDENGMAVTVIYTLDGSLNTVSVKDGLLPGVIIGSVKFDENFASLFEKEKTEPSLVVDLTKTADEESAEVSEPSAFPASYVTRFSDSGMLGISAVSGEDGYSSLLLEMYDSLNGVKVNEIAFAEISSVDSPALTDKKAMLVDEENNIIGIPVSGRTEFGVVNMYYIFSYDDELGFSQKGLIEYNDIDGSYKFERAVVDNGNLIIIGSGRWVSVRLSDMTVTDTVDFG